jgi:hypothetical protein
MGGFVNYIYTFMRHSYVFQLICVYFRLMNVVKLNLFPNFAVQNLNKT